MKSTSITILIFSLLAISTCSNVIVGTTASKNFCEQVEDDFYFVHITDTHVMHKLFDYNEISKKRFKAVLDRVCSFENKPAFIVITGDLTEWGGGGVSGALNCQAFASCLYKKEGQFYADASYSIPIYTTPGNHEYNYNRNLSNYLRFIENDDRYVVNYSDISLFFMNSGPNHYAQPGKWFKHIDGDGLYDCDISWFEDALSKCNSSHKIVLMHHPAVNFRDDNGRMYDVVARNRKRFVNLCEEYNVDLVLTGHTHESKVFDSYENFYYDNTSLNCSLYPTLYVQTDDCKGGIHYRNVSAIDDDIWLESCIEINFKPVVQ